MGQAYAGHESILVAEVDCTSAGAKKLCDEEGVEGFPTLRPGWKLRILNSLGVAIWGLYIYHPLISIDIHRYGDASKPTIPKFGGIYIH